MTELFSIVGKRVLITGGAQGLGRMIAERLLQAGAQVIITSRKPEVAEEAAEAMRRFGECIGLQANLSSAEGTVALADQIKAQQRPLHVLINNAGKTWGAPLENFPDKAWPDIMSINVQAPFTLLRELLPVLRATGTADDPARVINLGSYVGLAVERLPAYSYAASKAAIHHLTRVLAADLAESHITVNAVAPGYFSTRMTSTIDKAHMRELPKRIPLGRMGTPDDIAGACIFLSSRAGAYLTGILLPVDGGMSGCR